MCGRQIVSYFVETNDTIGGKPFIMGDIGMYYCYRCVEEMEESGEIGEEFIM